MRAASSSYHQLKFYAGTSGLQLPVPRSQYPEEYQGVSRLTYYASLFNSIEINSSFYKLPQGTTVEKWQESVPADFRFTFKLSKTITHAKGFKYESDDVAKFFDVMHKVQSRKGCILVQFPPSCKDDYVDDLKSLIADIHYNDNDRQWKIAVEFRDNSWYSKYVTDWLDDNNVAVVIHDIPRSATKVRQERTDFIYLRFHGPEGKYRGTYPSQFLQKQATAIQSWLKEGKEVYAYFNNTMGEALTDLQMLVGLVHGR